MGNKKETSIVPHTLTTETKPYWSISQSGIFLFLERAYAGLFQEPILIFGHIIQSSKFQLVFDSS